MLTDALVASSNTNTGLQDNVTAAAVHADESYAKARINLGIELGDMSGELSDARILGLTTTDGLVELTYAATSNAGCQPPE